MANYNLEMAGLGLFWMGYFSTYANPLYSTADLRQIRILHIRPTSTWFYSCFLDLWPQRSAPCPVPAAALSPDIVLTYPNPQIIQK